MSRFICFILPLFLVIPPAFSGGVGVFASHMDTSDLDNSVGIGGRLLVDLSQQMQLDLSVAYHDNLDDSIAGQDLELELVPVELGGLLKIQVSDTRVFPYIGAGAGYYRLDLDDGNPLTDNDEGSLDDEFGWYGVLGLDFRFSESFGFFFEGRYRQIEGTLEGNRFERFDEGDLDLDLGGITINTGLQISW